MRRRASRRSVSSCDSPGPRVPTPAPERAGAAAEALEVLPHAPHPRQVVLELRELDLELSLGAVGVLGEDVEDQLRAVDDARVERVLERPLLHGIELVVDEQHLGARVAVRLLQLLELALADVRARIRARALLDELGRPARRRPCAPARAARRARPRRRLPSRARRPRTRARAPRPRRGCRAGASSHRGLCHACADVRSLADRLAERTLELVDIPSESRHEAEIAAHVALARAAELRRRSTAATTPSSARRRGARGGRSSSSPATTTPSPRRRTSPGRIEDGAVHRARRERHEGRRSP